MKKNIKKIIKVVIWIIISIFVFIIIAYWLFCGNDRYIFPKEIGKIELNHDIRVNVIINCSRKSVLDALEQIEQEQGYVNIEELEQLREEFENSEPGYYIISYRRPLRYIIWHKGQALLGKYWDEAFGSNGHYGEDNGNVLYFYRVKQKIDWPYDGEI